jgi:hypothetical protein
LTFAEDIVQRDSSAKNVPIFVDEGTGFSFVKLSTDKWTFVRQIESEKMNNVSFEYKINPGERETQLLTSK